MDDKDIYHYTFGLVLNRDGETWRVDKRGYFGAYPRRRGAKHPANTQPNTQPNT